MSAVTRERVVELLADSTTEYNSARAGDDDDAARFWGPMKDALTRLLALEDALGVALDALKRCNSQSDPAHEAAHDISSEALAKIAALGGGK